MGHNKWLEEEFLFYSQSLSTVASKIKAIEVAS